MNYKKIKEIVKNDFNYNLNSINNNMCGDIQSIIYNYLNDTSLKYIYILGLLCCNDESRLLLHHNFNLIKTMANNIPNISILLSDKCKSEIFILLQKYEGIVYRKRNNEFILGSVELIWGKYYRHVNSTDIYTIPNANLYINLDYFNNSYFILKCRKSITFTFAYDDDIIVDGYR